jgi:hypothetical protein
VRRGRSTTVAALTLDEVIAAAAGHVVEGSLRRNGYLHFLEHSVVLVNLVGYGIHCIEFSVDAIACRK